MAGRYSQTFSLEDIFNNKKLRGKLPLMYYKEVEKEGGKLSQRTRPKSIGLTVYNASTKAARAYYKPLIASKKGDTIIINGTLVGSHDAAVDAVYNAILAQRGIIEYTANNVDMIRDAMKEAGKNKKRNGIESKLYLRAQSIQEIEGMSKSRLNAFLNNVMENIFFGDDFPETQKKYKVEEIARREGWNYTALQNDWKMRVGE